MTTLLHALVLVCTAVGGGVMELQEFYEYMEQHRTSAVDAAMQRYRSLTPLLGKVGRQLGWCTS